MTNPEQSVIDAIDGLERDEIGELVDWQLEQGRQRGEYGNPYYAVVRDRLRTDPFHTPGSLWRIWDENWNLVRESDEMPTEWTEGRYVTVDRPYGSRHSWRMVDGTPVPEPEFLRPASLWQIPYTEWFTTPTDPSDPLGSPTLMLARAQPEGTASDWLAEILRSTLEITASMLCVPIEALGDVDYREMADAALDELAGTDSSRWTAQPVAESDTPFTMPFWLPGDPREADQ